MKPSLWFRFRSFGSRHAMKIALVIVAVAAVAALAGVRWEARHRAEAAASTLAAAVESDRIAAAERRRQICQESRNLRALVSELIDTAVGDDPNGGVRFDEVPSFRSMPASVQQFLRDYAAAQARGEEGPDLAERLRTFQEDRLGDLPEFCTEAA